MILNQPPFIYIYRYFLVKLHAQVFNRISGSGQSLQPQLPSDIFFIF